MTGTEIVYLLGAVAVLLVAGLVLLFVGPRRDVKQPPDGQVAKDLDDHTAAIYTTRPRHRQRVTGVAHVDNRHL